MIHSFKVIDKTTGKEVDAGELWIEKSGEPAYRDKARFWLSADGDLALFDAVGNEIVLSLKRYEAVAE